MVTSLVCNFHDRRCWPEHLSNTEPLNLATGDEHGLLSLSFTKHPHIVFYCSARSVEGGGLPTDLARVPWTVLVFSLLFGIPGNKLTNIFS